MEETNIKKEKLISVGELFRKSIDIYKENFKDIILVMLIPLIITTIVYFVPSFGLLSLLVSIFSLGFLLYLDKNKEVSLKESIVSVFKKRFIAILILQILSIVIIFGGLFLFLIPGIYIIFALFASSYFVVLENNKPIEGILKSWEYFKGKGWGIFFRVLLLSIIVAFLSSIIGKTFGEESVVTGIIYSLLSSLVLGPISLIYSYLIYKDIKRIKGDNLEIKKSRKIKFWILFVVGVVVPVVIVAIVASNAGNIMNKIMLEYNQLM
jgi:hypothetical protein